MTQKSHTSLNPFSSTIWKGRESYCLWRSSTNISSELSTLFLLQELILTLSNPNFTFLVIRHIRHQLEDKFVDDDIPYWLYDFILESFNRLTRDHIFAFEKELEWSEFDEVIQHFENSLLKPYSSTVLDMILRCVIVIPLLSVTVTNKISRNSEKCPKTLAFLPEWISGMNSDDMGEAIEAYRTLHDIKLGLGKLQNSDNVSYLHTESTSLLRRGLENPLDTALAEICAGCCRYSFSQHSRQTAACNVLVGFIARSENRMTMSPKNGNLCLSLSSDDSYVQQRISRCVRIALSASRYTRKRMLDALTSSEFAKRDVLNQWAEETKMLCIPNTYPDERGLASGDPDVEGYGFFRHCGDEGQFIHLQVCKLYNLLNNYPTHCSHLMVHVMGNAVRQKNILWTYATLGIWLHSLFLLEINSPIRITIRFLRVTLKMVSLSSALSVLGQVMIP